MTDTLVRSGSRLAAPARRSRVAWILALILWVIAATLGGFTYWADQRATATHFITERSSALRLLIRDAQTDLTSSSEGLARVHEALAQAQGRDERLRTTIERNGERLASLEDRIERAQARIAAAAAAAAAAAEKAAREPFVPETPLRPPKPPKICLVDDPKCD